MYYLVLLIGTRRLLSNYRLLDWLSGTLGMRFRRLVQMAFVQRVTVAPSDRRSRC